MSEPRAFNLKEYCLLHIPRILRGDFARQRLFWNLLIMSISLFMLGGCGVHSNVIPVLSLMTSEQALQPLQTATLYISGTNTSRIPIELSLSCNASSCGNLSGYQYTAPADVGQKMTVTIKAANADYPEQSASVQLTIYPKPQVTFVTPDYVTAGTLSTLTISGSGFVPESKVELINQNDNVAAALSKVSISSSSTISAAISIPQEATGRFSVVVKSPLASIPPAQSQAVYVLPYSLAGYSSSSIFNVLDYGASGSNATYSCSGNAGSANISCSGLGTDFVPGEGIRIVAAGGLAVVPSVSTVTIQKHNDDSNGTHTYCYMVFAADAAGGITEGSTPSCATGEPANLSYTGTYNTFSSPNDIPLATFLWYRSKDGGPYQLFSVNGTMDVGQQPSAFGGWPLTLPDPSDDISKREDLFARVLSVHGNQITLDRTLCTTVEDVMVDHDDSAAIQRVINEGAGIGGAEIYLPPGTYNLRRPQLLGRPNTQGPYFAYTTSYSFDDAYVWSPWYYLTIPPGSTGNIHFVGAGDSTVINLPPNSGGNASLLGFDPMTHPAYSPFQAYGIEPADYGATTITLTSDPPPSVSPGTDIWIYGGSFYLSSSPACVDIDGTAGGNCHNSELNTVVSIDGRTLHLKYPLSKDYFDDGVNSFGVVPLPTCVHNLSLENLNIYSNNRVIGVSILYGLLVDHVTVHGEVAGGVFGGGPKRDLVIENSEWSIGEGDASWLGTSEYDQEVGVVLLHDTVMGSAAVGAEGPSLNARLYLTEGTSDVYIVDNTFNHVSLYTQESTDDFIEHNEFRDGNIATGYAYVPSQYPHNKATTSNSAFLSFGPQRWAAIEDNTLTFDPGFMPPWAILVGHYQDASVANNTIRAVGQMDDYQAIVAYSGTVENNNIVIPEGTASTIAVLAVPDFGPGVRFTPFNLKDNNIVIGGNSPSVAIGVVGPNIFDSQEVCINGNTSDIGRGTSIYVWNKQNVTIGCN